MQNVRIHIILHMREVSSGHLLSIETSRRIQWFCGQQRPRSDCAHAQEDLGPGRPNMPEDTQIPR